MIPIGEAIRAAREQTGMNRAELNRRLTGNPKPGSYINKVEAGEISPTVDTLERIATALGMGLIIEFSPCPPVKPRDRARRPRAGNSPGPGQTPGAGRGEGRCR